MSATKTSPKQKSASSTTAKPPVHEIRVGRIKAVIWENETQQGTRHNVSFARIYKDGEVWKDSTSFGRDDLPLIQKVADRAFEWIYEHNANGS